MPSNRSTSESRRCSAALSALRSPGESVLAAALPKAVEASLPFGLGYRIADASAIYLEKSSGAGFPAARPRLSKTLILARD